ncbi:flagellin [Marinococcus halophilus]|uniref:Flagellin n=1 Tax=Marinococcus halophilus TaxID=1371 RepID=A0A510Y9U0_MARHA|nr:flagellin [Marinococcus halophilus]OZT78878.1 flagellin [Marinococcus halophilus]GEK60118.1 flagellin [Marinococcus halophilus]
MIINHNLGAMNAQRQMSANQNNMGDSMEKLSSGLRINRAGDDAAGLAISEKMRGQIRGLEQADRNAQDGISMIQTAEGALNETHSILQRMRELAVQSSNDTNNGTDREEIQKEVDQLSQELGRISDNTEFNTQNLLDGSFTGKFHIGANTGQNIEISINDMSAEALSVAKTDTVGTSTVDDDIEITNSSGDAITIAYATDSDDTANDLSSSFDEDSNTLTINLAQNDSNAVTSTKDEIAQAINDSGKLTATIDANGGDTFTDPGTDTTVAAATFDDTKGIDVSTQENASNAISTINNAIESVSAERSKLGAYQNRLDHTINNLGTSAENLQAAESRIRDVDMAKEMMNMTKNNILSQASQSMLAQANQQPQSVLQLLQ